jgi:hypothetical protein
MSLRDGFLKAFQDTDDTVHTGCHGKIFKAVALFRVVRAFRVQKSQGHVLKKHCLGAMLLALRSLSNERDLPRQVSFVFVDHQRREM